MYLLHLFKTAHYEGKVYFEKKSIIFILDTH